MMRTLRKKMTIFLWFAVGAFVAYIFLQWGMNIMGRRSGSERPGMIAEVNGQSVSYEYYRAFLNRFRRTELERLGVDRLDESEEAALEERAFEQLVADILWWQAIRDRGIRVTDQEVVAFIRSNPPATLLQDTTLFTDGQFDPDKYVMAIFDPRNLSWLNRYEREIRASLPKQKLQMDLLSTVKLTDTEVRRAYDRRNQRFKVAYVLLTPGEYEGEIVLSPEDLTNYYQANREDFLQPARARLSYAHFDKIPSLEDELGVREEIQELWRRAKEGEDFAELAREFSDDVSTAREGGDLGLFGRGEMVKPFEEACFSLRVGQVSPPVKTAFGWHLIKLEARKGEKVRARHILLRIFPSLRTLETLRERAENFLKDLREGGPLDEVAAAYEVETAETPLFSRQDDFIPGIGISRPAVEFAFEAKTGEISDVVETSQAYLVLRLLERKESGIPPFEETKSQVEEIVRRQRARELALAEADSLVEETRGGKGLKRAASARARTLHTPPPFTLGEYAPGVPWEDEFRGCVFALKKGEVSGVVETERGFYVIELLEKDEVDAETLKEEIGEFAQTLINEKQTRILQDWFDSVKAAAKVEDRRFDLQ